MLCYKTLSSPNFLNWTSSVVRITHLNQPHYLIITLTYVFDKTLIFHCSLSRIDVASITLIIVIWCRNTKGFCWARFWRLRALIWIKVLQFRLFYWWNEVISLFLDGLSSATEFVLLFKLGENEVYFCRQF